MTELNPVLCILCGGFSRRMGQDKASAMLCGETLLVRAARRHGNAASRILIATRADGPGTASGFEIVADPDPGGGPLQAMVAALQHAGGQAVFVMPVDMPFLPASTAEELAVRRRGASCVGFVHQGVVQPLPVLLRAAALPYLQDVVRNGARRADSWKHTPESAVVEFAEAFPERDATWCLGGVNDAEALARAEVHCRAQRVRD